MLLCSNGWLFENEEKSRKYVQEAKCYTRFRFISPTGHYCESYLTEMLSNTLSVRRTEIQVSSKFQDRLGYKSKNFQHNSIKTGSH